jgi:hypothetical protein
LSTPGGSSSSTRPVVTTLTAPPSTKVAVGNATDTRGDKHLSKDATQEIIQQQIERLDSAAWSEWQFDFGGPVSARARGGSSDAESPKHQPPTRHDDARVHSNNTQPQSRCSTRGSQSDSFSSNSRRSTSPTDSLGAPRDIATTSRQVSSTAEAESQRKGYSYQHISLAELNGQISSMHKATNALL